MTDTIKPISNLLVPVDFSESSLCALEFAKRLAAPVGARLHLLYVDDDPMLVQKSTSSDLRDEHESKMAERFAEVLTPEEQQRFQAVLCVQCGTAYYEIEQYAEQHDIDLIVIGSVGRSAIADAFVGSVTSHVVRHACCPVVTVRC